MARRVITEAMREAARERAHAYLAARSMTTAEVDQLAGYHGRQARHGAFTPEASRAALVTARMLCNLVARRTACAWYVTPASRAMRARRVRYTRTR